MSVKQDPNLSYLLHLWKVERNGEPVWWSSLENPRTGERQAFADLAELFAFLDEKTVNWLQPSGEDDLEPLGDTTISLTTPVSDTRARYLSYLLRLLSVDREGNPAWRVSLQSPHAADRLNFADLEAMIRYLEEKLREAND
jgi:hypothetical protein